MRHPLKNLKIEKCMSFSVRRPNQLIMKQNTASFWSYLSQTNAFSKHFLCIGVTRLTPKLLFEVFH